MYVKPSLESFTEEELAADPVLAGCSCEDFDY